MNTDLELLELAAKAAGLPWDKWVEDGDASWNPLQDDGDALRLAVKLKLSVTVFEDDVGVGYKLNGIGRYEEYPIEKDANEATRRAIVRAAAEVGKSI